MVDKSQGPEINNGSQIKSDVDEVKYKNNQSEVVCNMLSNNTTSNLNFTNEKACYLNRICNGGSPLNLKILFQINK